MVKNETFLGIYFILDVIRWWSRVENGNGNGSNEVGEERWWEMGMVPGCEIWKLNIYIYIYLYIYILPWNKHLKMISYFHVSD